MNPLLPPKSQLKFGESGNLVKNKHWGFEFVTS